MKNILSLIHQVFFGKHISPVEGNEEISRFVFSKRDMSPQFQRLKHRAFLPPKSNPHEISVYRVNDISEETIWCLGQKYAGNKSSPIRKLKGRGDIKVEDIYNMDFSEVDIYDNTLSVKSAPRPHRRHANIHFQKNLDDAKKLHIANKLSMKSKLIKVTGNISLEHCSDQT